MFAARLSVRTDDNLKGQSVKKAPLNTFAALAVAALCAGTVFVGCDYVQSGEQNAAENDLPASEAAGSPDEG